MRETESVSLLLWLQSAFGRGTPVRAGASSGPVFALLQHELLLHSERVRLWLRSSDRLLLLNERELRLLLRIAARRTRDERRARRTRSAR